MRPSDDLEPPDSGPTAPPSATPPHAIRWLLFRAAIGLGILGNLLLRVEPWGVNLSLWLLALAWSAAVFGLRSGVFRTRAETWPLLLMVVGGVGVALRDSPLLLLADLAVIALGGLLLAVQAGTGAALRAMMGALLDQAVALARSLAQGIAPLVPALWRDLRASTRANPAVRTGALGVLLATPFLLLFGSLLTSADPLFNHYASRVLGSGWGTLMSHVILTGFFTWLVAGWLFGTLRAGERRGPSLVSRVSAPDGAVTLVALRLLATLLMVFLGVQLRAVVGGQDYVLETTGLTYAEYARAGFFQLVAVAALILPTLMAAGWSVESTAPEQRDRFRRLAMLVLASAGVLLVSAFARMRLYQSQYGLTEDRFYTQAFMLWLGFVLMWFAATHLYGRRDRFLGPPLFVGLALLMTLNVMNPAAIIVRANHTDSVATAEARPFDALHASYLGADAVPTLLGILPDLSDEHACVVSQRLENRWLDRAAPDWRSWNLSRWQARTLVHSQARMVRQKAGLCAD